MRNAVTCLVAMHTAGCWNSAAAITHAAAPLLLVCLLREEPYTVILLATVLSANTQAE